MKTDSIVHFLAKEIAKILSTLHADFPEAKTVWISYSVAKKLLKMLYELSQLLVDKELRERAIDLHYELKCMMQESRKEYAKAKKKQREKGGK